ncbi:MAG: VOC family protein [Trueperaceae bacterium]|nr:VOC family protein [Trueperaceae bacterium]
MANALNWFEIPVADTDRAKAFYSTVLDAELTTQDMMGEGLMTILPYQNGQGVGGALVQSESLQYTPSQTGSVIYLNGGDDLSVPLSKVESAGGKVLAEKMSIGENGFIAFFLDTEGNKVGLHSMN